MPCCGRQPFLHNAISTRGCKPGRLVASPGGWCRPAGWGQAGQAKKLSGLAPGMAAACQHGQGCPTAKRQRRMPPTTVRPAPASVHSASITFCAWKASRPAQGTTEEPNERRCAPRGLSTCRPSCWPPCSRGADVTAHDARFVPAGPHQRSARPQRPRKGCSEAPRRCCSACAGHAGRDPGPRSSARTQPRAQPCRDIPACQHGREPERMQWRQCSAGQPSAPPCSTSPRNTRPTGGPLTCARRPTRRAQRRCPQTCRPPCPGPAR